MLWLCFFFLTVDFDSTWITVKMGRYLVHTAALRSMFEPTFSCKNTTQCTPSRTPSLSDPAPCCAALPLIWQATASERCKFGRQIGTPDPGYRLREGPANLDGCAGKMRRRWSAPRSALGMLQEPRARDLRRKCPSGRSEVESVPGRLSIWLGRVRIMCVAVVVQQCLRSWTCQLRNKVGGLCFYRNIFGTALLAAAYVILRRRR